MKKFLAIFCLVLILISCNIYSCKAELTDDKIEVLFEPEWANGVINSKPASEIMVSSKLRAFVSAALYYDLFTSGNKNIPISSDDSSELLLNDSYIHHFVNNQLDYIIVLYSNNDYLIISTFSPGVSVAGAIFMKNPASSPSSLISLIKDKDTYYLNDKKEIQNFIQQISNIFSEVLKSYPDF